MDRLSSLLQMSNIEATCEPLYTHSTAVDSMACMLALVTACAPHCFGLIVEVWASCRGLLKAQSVTESS